MSYQDGMAAINMEMPSRVPRTEYSADRHWPLVSKVCGLSVNEHSSEDERQKASEAFLKKWNYDFFWTTLVTSAFLGDVRTNMGHASYAAGGTDMNYEVCCPFKSPEEVLDFDPMVTYGRIDHREMVRKFDQHFENQKNSYPDVVNMTGIYITCVSGLIDIFGWDMMLLAAGTDLKKFGELTNRYARWIQYFFNALADCSADVVMVHDDIVWTSGAFISPDWYREYVFPNYKKFFEPLKEAGKKIMYTSDGNYSMFIDDIAKTGVNGFVMEPTTDMKYIADNYGKTHSFIGNADVRILMENDRDKIYQEVKRCMDIGKDCPGFFMAVGNHIPSNVPVEAAVFYNEVYQQLSKR